MQGTFSLFEVANTSPSHWVWWSGADPFWKACFHKGCYGFDTSGFGQPSAPANVLMSECLERGWEKIKSGHRNKNVGWVSQSSRLSYWHSLDLFSRLNFGFHSYIHQDAAFEKQYFGYWRQMFRFHTTPCIFLGVALSECQSAWTWDLHWLPAGQRWVLRAYRLSCALSWPLRQKISAALLVLSLNQHRNFPRLPWGSPVPPRPHSLLRWKACGMSRVDTNILDHLNLHKNKKLHWQTFPFFFLQSFWTERPSAGCLSAYRIVTSSRK